MFWDCQSDYRIWENGIVAMLEMCWLRSLSDERGPACCYDGWFQHPSAFTNKIIYGIKTFDRVFTILIDNEGADLPKAVPRKRTKFDGDDELAVVPSNKGLSLNLDNNRIPWTFWNTVWLMSWLKGRRILSMYLVFWTYFLLSQNISVGPGMKLVHRSLTPSPNLNEPAVLPRCWPPSTPPAPDIKVEQTCAPFSLLLCNLHSSYCIHATCTRTTNLLMPLLN